MEEERQVGGTVVGEHITDCRKAPILYGVCSHVEIRFRDVIPTHVTFVCPLYSSDDS
jgi:hypothetical protein